MTHSSLNSGPNRPLFLLRVLLRLCLDMVLSLVRNWADCSRFTGGRFVKRPYGILTAAKRLRYLPDIGPQGAEVFVQGLVAPADVAQLRHLSGPFGPQTGHH